MDLPHIVCQHASYLKAHGIEEPENEVLWLLSAILNQERGALILQKECPITEEQENMLLALIQRRALKEPYEYLVGVRSFLGVSLKVDPRVLIPRHETEFLADKIQKELMGKELEGKVLWDLCTGSGALAIALKNALHQLTVYGSDLSWDAVECARKNALQNAVEVTFYHGDLFEPLMDQMCDFFVANPPYVSPKEFESLPDEVRCFEPKMALIADQEGLLFYQRIAKELPRFLHPHGKGWLEIGKDQGNAVKDLFEKSGFQVTIAQDLAGHDRYVEIEF